MGISAQMRQALESGVIDGYISERPEALTAEAANSSFKMIQFKRLRGWKKKMLPSQLGCKKTISGWQKSMKRSLKLAHKTK